METQNITVSLPTALHRRLTRQCRALTRKTGLATRSQIVRAALVEWLERAESVAVLAGGEPTGHHRVPGAGTQKPAHMECSSEADGGAR